MTAKEVTLNYLKSIKRDLENAINRPIGKGEHLLKLDIELITMIDAIEIVSESEGENK